MRWQKLLSKNAQNLFSLINLMKDLIWRKTDLAEELKIDVKTVDRHLKRLAESDCPIQLILHKKTVQLVYDQGYSEPYLLFVFLIQSPPFCLLKNLLLNEPYEQEYDRSTQERLRKWFGEYHLSFSYKKAQIFGSERKIRYLLFCFLKDFPHFFADDGEQSFSETFIQLLKQRKDPAEIEILGDSRTLFFELFPELLFREEQILPIKEKNYLAILRLSCNQITEKRWERIEETQDYRKLTIVTEKLDSLFWLNSEFESGNKSKLTKVLYQEWLRYVIGIHDRLVEEEVRYYQETLEKFPNSKDKLYQFRLAIQQALAHPVVEWGMLLLKTLQERGYLDVHPPEVKIVFFFRYEHQEARRLAGVLNKTLRHRKRISIHVCTRNKPPRYADLVITDHFFPLDHNEDQKTYLYHPSFGIERLLTDINYWLGKNR